MSQRCVLSPLPWDLSHANECARMQILRPAASLLDLALGSWLGICVLAPYPHPHVSEAKGAGRNLPVLTPRSTVSWGGHLRWEFCLF